MAYTTVYLIPPTTLSLGRQGEEFGGYFKGSEPGGMPLIAKERRRVGVCAAFCYDVAGEVRSGRGSET